jgi:hypothetical protein
MGKMKINGSLPSSFRDPSGFLFYRRGLIYRQINKIYKKDYDFLMESGLYKALTKAGLLIPHKEVNLKERKSDKVYKIIKPELIPFISYPYEWCFSQLKNAALTILRIQKRALDFGMFLKDGSAYNIQFQKGKAVLIDSLSFEKYRPGQSWLAYRQFCQHFLAPLALMSYKDIRLNKLLLIYLDGIPLDLASLLLPLQSYWRFSLLSHLHLHARSQEYFASKTVEKESRKISKLSLRGLIDSLQSGIERLNWQPRQSEWGDYYQHTNYSHSSFEYKKRIVAEFLEEIKPRNVWDLGANIGVFSRLASAKGIETVSFDVDAAAVEKNYLECLKNNEVNMLPLLIDLFNPSPSIGWENQERLSLIERGPTETALALALIHHLAIANNLPFSKIANFLNQICQTLIIEFVPKNDSQVQRLLSSREDIFPDYKAEFFERAFKQYFKIRKWRKIKGSKRILYLMQKK